MDKIEQILRRYPFYQEDIRAAQEQLNKYIVLQQDARDPLKAQKLSFDPRGTGTNDQTLATVEIILDRYQTEIDKYAKTINDILDEKQWLDKAFSELTEPEWRVVHLRYDKGMHISKIQYVMHSGRPYIYKILDEAKTKIRRIMA